MNIVKTSAFVSHILKENMLCTSFSKVDLVTEVTFFKIFFFFFISYHTVCWISWDITKLFLQIVFCAWTWELSTIVLYFVHFPLCGIVSFTAFHLQQKSKSCNSNTYKDCRIQEFSPKWVLAIVDSVCWIFSLFIQYGIVSVGDDSPLHMYHFLWYALDSANNRMIL